MKKLIVAAIFPWFATIFGQSAMAQDTPAPEVKKETQEITIRKKGDKDVTLNLQITGDKVIVNGKPLIEFSDDAITINKKKIVIGNKMDFNIDDLHFDDFTTDDIQIRSFGPKSKNKEVIVRGYGSSKNRPFLGVATENVDGGAKIISITKESAAEAAGLQKDDIITKVNDTKVDGSVELSDAISKLKAKDEVKITYKRGDKKEKTVKTTLKENKSTEVRSFTFNSTDGGSKMFGMPGTSPMPPMPDGFSYNGDNKELFISSFKKQKLGIKIQDTEEGNGVKILDVDTDSPAATAGVLKDDILTELNGKKITNTDEAREQLQANLENNNYPLKVKRNGTEITLNVKIPKKLKTVNL